MVVQADASVVVKLAAQEVVRVVLMLLDMAVMDAKVHVRVVPEAVAELAVEVAQ